MDIKLIRKDKHIVLCGDICDGAHRATLRELCDAIPERPVVMYCDPPWNAGITTMFSRRAGISNRTFEHTLECLVDMVREWPRPTFVEMGLQKTGYLVDLVKSRIGVDPAVAQITYGYGAKCNLLYFNPSGLNCDYSYALREAAGSDDRRTPKIVMSAISGSGLVVDPFLGQGTTLRCAEQAGWRCAGIELCVDRARKAAEHFS